MSETQMLITILAVALATALTRFLPFILFPAGRPTPPYVAYLGRVLPYASVGLLIVYCLKSVSLAPIRGALDEIIAIAIIVAVHLKWRNTLISIAAGTAAYMVLTQLAVF